MADQSLQAATDRFMRRLESTTSGGSLKRIGNAAGMAGKKAALAGGAKGIGGDLAMSGDVKGRRLRAGYDVRSGGVDINLRPKGWWVLADSGRKRTGLIDSPFGAVRVPGSDSGWRAYSFYTPSRGTGARQKAQDEIEQAVPKAAFQALQREIGAVLRG